jgi:hypothetical protein
MRLFCRRQYSNCEAGVEDPKELCEEFEEKISLVQDVGRSK